jgi:SAM-dependent methyltransferase
MINLNSSLCPVCKNGKIVKNQGDLFCSNNECNNSFLSILGKPVLVNFNNSVIQKEEILSKQGESIIQLNEIKFIKILKNIIFGHGYVTKKNISKISKNLNSNIDSKILIIGGGTIGSGLSGFYKDFSSNIDSFDIYYSANIDFIADAHDIPIMTNYYDLVIIQAVLEHVIDPFKVVEECFRVMKYGGYIYAETPFMQQVHEGPFDFTRFTDSGHRSLFRNFKLISSGAVAGVGTSLMWSLGYFFSGLFRSYKVGLIFRILFFWLRFVDRIILEKYNIDGASGVFFYGMKDKTFTSISNIQLISYYRGAQ